MSSLDPIATLLTRRGALPEALVQRALSEARSKAAFLGTVLELGVPEDDLVAIVAEHLGIPGVDLSRTAIDLAVLETIPRIVAESDLVLPLSTEGARLHVAVSAGADQLDVLEELRFITGYEVSPYAALPGPLELAIAAAYDGKDRGETLWRGSGLQPGAQAAVAVVLPPPLAQVPALLDEGEVIEDLEPILEGDKLEDDLNLEVGEEEGEESEVLDAFEVRVGPARILAVDDDPDILRLMDRTLRSAGYTVELAKDGREAEEKIKAHRYDLILLDAMLPYVHGFEICSRLKGSARTRNWPVILVSAIYKGWRYAHDARESFGADDFLEKPFRLPELLKRVAARLEGAAQLPQAPTDLAESLYQKGMALLENKQAGEARVVLEQAIKDDPHSARAQFALARALHEQGDLFHAISAYERAIELRPNLFPALRALAGLYQEKGFRRKAVEALERALHAAPDAATREQIRQRLIKLL